MAVKVRDLNMPRYKAAPLGSVLPSAGGPFKQRTSIFGDPKNREDSPVRGEASAHVVRVQRKAQAQAVIPKIRVMASAVPEPEPLPSPVPESANDGFLGQVEDVPSQIPSVAGTILLIALGVGLVIVLAD